MKFARTPFLLLLALCVVAHSCKEEPPNAPTQPPPPLLPQPVQTIALTVVDSASVEAWLKLSMPDTVKERRYRLYLNDSLLWQATLTKPDTLILIGLAPATTYRARAERLTTDTFNVTVDEKTFRTLDTTNQDYVWTVQTFGIGFGGILRDVCVINDSCIWAVGRIDSGLYDSLGAPIIYNAMRYDGHQWHYIQIKYDQSVFEHFSVIGFAENDVWLATGGRTAHWDGNRFTMAVIGGDRQGGILKLWGTSSSNIYAVGDLGTIAHYDGTTWRRMESGTTAHLVDIYGTPDGKSVWVAGYRNSPFQSCLLSLENGQCRTIWQTGQTSPPSYASVLSLWTSGSSEFVVLGNATAHFHSRLAQNIARPQQFLMSGGGFCVRGNARNNLFAGGQVGILWHYNGAHWKRFADLSRSFDWYRSIGVGNALVVAVGQRGGAALVAIGRKQP